MTDISAILKLAEGLDELVLHSKGMSFGEDWNKGTHANHHRGRLIRAARSVPCNAGEIIRVLVEALDCIARGELLESTARAALTRAAAIAKGEGHE